MTSRFVALALAAVLVPSRAPARTLVPEDASRIVSLEQPAISPDARTVAVIEESANAARSGYDRRLVLVDVRSGAQRVLVPGRDPAVPRWSPDGRALAYLARDSDGARAIMLRGADGRTRRITVGGGGAVDLAWRPDGTALAVARTDVLPQRDHFDVGDNDLTATGPTAPVHLWLVPVSGAQRRLTSGAWTVAPTDAGGIFTSQFAWSRDGRTITFTRVETTFSGENEYSTLRRLDVARGTIVPLTAHRLGELSPLPSPDGRRLAYWYPRDGDVMSENELHVLGDGRDDVIAADLDRNIAGTLWMPDGSLLLCADDGARVRAWIASVSGSRRTLDLGAVSPVCDSYSSSTFDSGIAASVAHDGTIALVGTSARDGRELYVVPPHAAPRRLTAFNAFLDGVDLPRMSAFAWRRGDGEPMTGVLTRPPGARSGRRYPVVLLIHGGPGLASVVQFSWEHWPLAAMIAARGYLVLQPNYRGSDDHGNAFMHAIVGDTVAGPADDVLSGLDAVKALPDADGARVAVSGWSYGGLLTSWLIAKRHDWRAAVSGAAVNDQVAEYDTSVTNVQNRYYLGARPHSARGMRLYRDQSPITYAADVTTPTLIWSSTGDAVVPTSQSYAFYHALRDNGVPVRFVQFVGAAHGPSTPLQIEELTHLWLDWLDRYVR